MDNLPGLRDLHLPLGVSIWPPALGWWVVLFGVLAFIVLFKVVRVLGLRSKKKYAYKLIDEVGVGNAVAAAMQMSSVLRRICVLKYKSAAALYGKEWIDFLNSKASVKLEGCAAELFLNAPYMDKRDANFKLHSDTPTRVARPSIARATLASPVDGEGEICARFGMEEIIQLEEFCRRWVGENL